MAHHATVDIMREPRRIDDVAPRIAARAWYVGVAGIVAALILAIIPGFRSGEFGAARDQFLRSYVLAFTYVCSIALGALFFVLIQHVTRAGWSVVVRRIAECIAAQLPWLGLLSLPILLAVWFGVAGVYPWSNADVVAGDALLQGKAPYLNKTFFTIRMVLYFGIWSWLAGYMLNKSVEQDLTGNDKLTLDMQRLSAPGILLFALTVTFFAVDLLMSLSPHFFSTIWGVLYFAGCMVATYATLIVWSYFVQRRGRLTNSLNQEHYHDLGKFMFAWIVFWTYISFSQYMLIWYGNLPEENFWYQARQHTGWWIGVGLTLLFGHFLLPFLLLLSRYPKRRPQLLLVAAVWMLVMHFFDLHYQVSPDVHGYLKEFADPDKYKMAFGAGTLLTDIPLVIGLGGIFVHLILREMSRYSLVPERDPRLNESLAFHNF